MTTSDQTFECPEGWGRFDSSCYWLVFDEVNWVEAQHGCSELHPGAHLASSGSELENDFIASSLYTSNVREFFLWLGGTDFEQEGNWTWTDSTPFNYTYWCDAYYCGGDEGNGGTGKNCLAINIGDSYSSTYKRWYDFGCFDLFSYVCEINLK